MTLKTYPFWFEDQDATNTFCRSAHEALGRAMALGLSRLIYHGALGDALLANKHITTETTPTWRVVVTDEGRSAYWSGLWLHELERRSKARCLRQRRLRCCASDSSSSTPQTLCARDETLTD